MLTYEADSAPPGAIIRLIAGEVATCTGLQTRLRGQSNSRAGPLPLGVECACQGPLERRQDAVRCLF